MCYKFGAGFCEYEMVLLQGSETGLTQGPMPHALSLSLSLSLSCVSFFSSNSFHSVGLKIRSFSTSHVDRA